MRFNRAFIFAVFVAVTRICHSEELAVSRDETNSQQRIVIPADNGMVAWSDVASGIARAQQLDDAVLRPFLPSGKMDMRRRGARYTLRALNLTLPGVHMTILRGDDNEINSLEILVDKHAFESARRDVTGLIRRQVNKNGRNDEALEYGLKLPSNWQDTSSSKHLVILVHGFNSRAEFMSGLSAAVEARGLPCASFAYPNDEPLDKAALGFSQSLKNHASKYPDQEIILISNSMGGLIARAVVEDATLDTGNVRQLIMIAPPNHGSALAQAAHGLDLWEFLLLPPEDLEVSCYLASICDGLAEANRDLRPSSPFLERLNARSRNPKVRYSILLGTAGPLSADGLPQLSEALHKASERSRTVRLVQPLVDDFLADLDEVVRDKGDGVVSIERGRLEGVEDTVLLNFRHPAAMSRHDNPFGPELIEAVIERLPQ